MTTLPSRTRVRHRNPGIAELLLNWMWDLVDILIARNAWSHVRDPPLRRSVNGSSPAARGRAEGRALWTRTWCWNVGNALCSQTVLLCFSSSEIWNTLIIVIKIKTVWRFEANFSLKWEMHLIRDRVNCGISFRILLWHWFNTRYVLVKVKQSMY